VVGHVGIAGAALAATFVSPALADYFIVQDATTKRCTRQRRPHKGDFIERAAGQAPRVAI
jgi:hypothetical protein